MSDGTNRSEDQERTMDGAQAPGWEKVDPPQHLGVGQPEILPPVPQPGQASGYAGPRNYPPPQGGYAPPQNAYGPPQGGYAPHQPPYGAQPGQGGYRPVYDGMGPQPPYGQPGAPQPGAPFMYNGQPYGGQQMPYGQGYPPQNYGFGTTAAEFLAASMLFGGWRGRRYRRWYGYANGGGYGRYRRHGILWSFLSLMFLLFVISHGFRMILHGW